MLFRSVSQSRYYFGELKDIYGLVRSLLTNQMNFVAAGPSVDGRMFTVRQVNRIGTRIVDKEKEPLWGKEVPTTMRLTPNGFRRAYPSYGEVVKLFPLVLYVDKMAARMSFMECGSDEPILVMAYDADLIPVSHEFVEHHCPLEDIEIDSSDASSDDEPRTVLSNLTQTYNEYAP